MKKAKICVISALFFSISCGKIKEDEQEKKQFLSEHRSTIKKKFSVMMDEINDKIDERTDSIGRGFNSITGLSAERCFENDSYIFINKPSSQIAYEENLSADQILSKLGIGVNATIPIQASGVPITLSPEVKYSLESAANSLARTSSITIEVIRGYNKIISKQSSFLKLKKEHTQIVKNNKTDFFTACGDEFIVKQKVKAKLLITAKFIFSDSKTKSEFEAAMGASMPVPFNLGGKKTASSTSLVTNDIPSPDIRSVTPPIRNRIAEPFAHDINLETNEIEPSLRTQPTSEVKNIKLTVDNLREELATTENDNGTKGMSPEIKIKVNKLSDDLKKNISISIKAIQLGGDPEKLPVLIAANCKLSDPGECDNLFTSIQNYAAKDFPEQLKPATELDEKKNNKKYYLAETEKTLYGNAVIFDSEGNNISKELLKLTEQSPEISKFKLKIRKDLRKNFQDYIRAQDIQNSQSYKFLANDEIKAVIETKENSENFLYTLFRFINTCFLDLEKCQKNYFEKVSLNDNYNNPLFDEIKTWSLVAVTQAEWKKPRYFGPFFRSDRISEDFFTPYQLKGYSNFMVKYLDMHRNRITAEKYSNTNLSTNLRCTTWFFDAYGKLFVQNLQPSKTYPITDNLISECRGKKLFASTRNPELERFGVFHYEIWAE